jgi:hypothetical protein
MEGNLRDAVTAAFEQDEQNDPVVPDTTTETPAPDEAIGAPADTSTEPTPPDQPSAERGERQRDSLGRFIPAAQADGKGQVAAPVDKAPVGLPVQPQPHPELERAPVNVPIGLRDQWATLPQPFREYTLKRENEVNQALQESSMARQFAGRFIQAIQPFQQSIQAAAGGDPVRAFTELLGYDAQLRYGTGAEKAGMVARIIQNYGVDIEALDQALVGAVPQQATGGADPAMIQRAVQQALSPLMSAAQQRQAQREQALGSEIAKEIDAFKADPKNEYFEDVRNLMADAMEIATRQGYELSVADAYERACMLHPEVRKIIVAKQNGQSAQSLTQAAQRAKAAAVSVKGSGAVVGSPEPSEPLSVRAAIERAIETHSRV